MVIDLQLAHVLKLRFEQQHQKILSRRTRLDPRLGFRADSRPGIVSLRQPGAAAMILALAAVQAKVAPAARCSSPAPWVKAPWSSWRAGHPDVIESFLQSEGAQFGTSHAKGGRRF